MELRVTEYVLHVIVFIISVLCSNRVSQMTKTYNDIEAVTRLLEEVSKASSFLIVSYMWTVSQNLICEWFL
jgi:hypothetical protein